MSRPDSERKASLFLSLETIPHDPSEDESFCQDLVMSHAASVHVKQADLTCQSRGIYYGN